MTCIVALPPGGVIEVQAGIGISRLDDILAAVYRLKNPLYNID